MHYETSGGRIGHARMVHDTIEIGGGEGTCVLVGGVGVKIIGACDGDEWEEEGDVGGTGGV